MLITPELIVQFLLILMRMGGVMVSAPLFNRRDLMLMSKVSLVFWTSFLILFVVPSPAKPLTTGLSLVMAGIIEFLIGLMMGFVCDLLITTLEFAGNLMDSQGGLSVAATLDPTSGRSMALLSLLLKNTATVMFLCMDGHHMVLSALLQSYQLIPLASHVNLAKGSYYIVSLGSSLFGMAVLLSAPVLLVIFLVDLGFGLMNKVAQQINVFQLGSQIKPLVATMIFLVTIPSLSVSVGKLLETTAQHVTKTLYLLGR